jgi:hypothetical protein
MPQDVMDVTNMWSVKDGFFDAGICNDENCNGAGLMRLSADYWWIIGGLLVDYCRIIAGLLPDYWLTIGIHSCVRHASSKVRTLASSCSPGIDFTRLKIINAYTPASAFTSDDRARSSPREGRSARQKLIASSSSGRLISIWLL